MRKIVLFMSMSLDGYAEGPKREIDWHRVDDELHGHFNDRLRAMSGFLTGRVTHELMASYWPTADEDPAAPARVAEYAAIWREMPKTVYSRSLHGTDRLEWNTIVKHAVDRVEILALKAQPGGDLALGGAGLAASLSELDLIDEYRVYIHPVLIGRGRPLFQTVDMRQDLGLVDTRTFGNGVVLLHYARVR
jgi:dihydrofolate reductase